MKNKVDLNQKFDFKEVEKYINDLEKSKWFYPILRFSLVLGIIFIPYLLGLLAIENESIGIVWMAGALLTVGILIVLLALLSLIVWIINGSETFK